MRAFYLAIAGGGGPVNLVLLGRAASMGRLGLRSGSVLAFIVLAVLASAAGRARADTKVIDASSGKSLPGVFVVATWSADVFKGVESSHTCFKVEAAQTNADGEFSLSSMSWNANPLLSNRRRTLQFYKRGYKSLDDGEEKDVYRMLADSSAGAARLGYLYGLGFGFLCGDSHGLRVLLPVYRAMYDESIEMAKSRTPEELKSLNDVMFLVDTVEVGYERALNNGAKRAQEWGIK